MTVLLFNNKVRSFSCQNPVLSKIVKVFYISGDWLSDNNHGAYQFVRNKSEKNDLFIENKFIPFFCYIVPTDLMLFRFGRYYKIS